MSAKQSAEMRKALDLVANGRVQQGARVSVTVTEAARLAGVNRTSLHRAIKMQQEAK